MRDKKDSPPQKNPPVTNKPVESQPQHSPLVNLQRSLGNYAFGRMIQAKLKISEPGDIYEQEADRVAEQVMRMPDPRVSGHAGDEEELLQPKLLDEHITTVIQRQHEPDKEEEEELFQAKPVGPGAREISPDIASSINSLKGGGQPLSQAERNFFEPRFGYDFSNVRVHTGSKASESARSINARAYTVGHDVVFGAGEYAPDTSPGRKLLAHELTHQIQQYHTPVMVQRQTFQESDFPTDTKHRVREDHYLREYGPRLAERGGVPDQPESLEELVNQLVDLVEPEQLLNKLIELRISSRATSYIERTSSEDRYRDIFSGLEKVHEYIEYVNKVIDYYNASGLYVELQPVFDEVSRITSILQPKVEQAIQLGELGLGTIEFVSVTRELFDPGVDLRDQNSVREWIDRLEQFERSAQPLIAKLREYLSKQAMRGSRAAARATLVGAYAIEMLQILAEAPDFALRLREYYEKKLSNATEDSQPTEPPTPPLPWISQEEILERAFERDRQILAQHLIQIFIAEFDEEIFPLRYRARRAEIRQRILRDLYCNECVPFEVHGSRDRIYYFEPGTYLSAQRWWDCLTVLPDAKLNFQENFPPTKERVNKDESLLEIQCFRNLHILCPYFQELNYEQERRRFVREKIEAVLD